jgi:signal transduction histidine kinase
VNRPPFTIRTRLALLYAAVFLIAGGALIGITYGLMRDAIFHQHTVDTVLADPGTYQPLDDPMEENKRQLKVALLQRESADGLVNAMTQRLGIVLGGLVVLGCVLGWVVSRQSLRPVQAITATARRVARGNLGERIALRGPRDELRELADTFDDMLGQLDAAFDSQRRFVANASHELRTPLAINRTLLEVAVNKPDAPPQVHDLAASLLQVNQRQQEMIDGLLALAESERRLSDRGPVDLAELVRATVTAQRGEADDRGVTITVSAEDATVTGDAVLLERLVVNLVQNAIRYNVPGGQVWVSCTASLDGVQVRVANTGPVLESEGLDEIFEPFRRRASRLESPEGNGLGLSIVRAVAQAHGGSVTARPRTDGGLLLVVSFPSRGS